MRANAQIGRDVPGPDEPFNRGDIESRYVITFASEWYDVKHRSIMFSRVGSHIFCIRTFVRIPSHGLTDLVWISLGLD